jgi:uncharacterized protein DUF6916
VDAQTGPRRVTRGGLIKAGAAAALVVGGGTAGRALAGGGASDLEGPGIGKPRGGAAHLRRATYAPLVGTDFRVHVPARRTLRVKLVEARKLRGPGEAFSLLFRGRRADVEGGIYRIDHPRLGAFELFVSPVGRGVKGLDLEAVVNRIAS